ncbi:MAG: cupin domain-containing protein [Rhizobiaceae bacterium]|nr:cupin domain-containing protein [Rhizobiaceae bacterium]MCV0405170.1 cupin domain-containing protein [Rhizobiaceae bacterium]
MSASDLFVTPTEADWTPVETGVKRRLLTHDDEMMVVEVAFEKGAVGAAHSHPHRQASVVAEGVFEVTIEGRTERLEKGGSFIVPSNAVHGCRALEAGRLIDTFTPARTEFLA